MMPSECEITQSRPTIEGAGVHLRRAFGFAEAPHFDPFLLLDDFRSANPSDYLPGFPWHPHRGIETITIILEGRVEHEDSLGNQGIIGPGDVQWMTAGSGIIHQEMPKGSRDGRISGLQLWANLPASHKMMPPRYRDVAATQIPEIELGRGVKVRAIAGSIHGVQGPVQDVVTDPEVLLVSIDPGGSFIHDTSPNHTVLAYVLSGSVQFGPEGERTAENGDLVSWTERGKIRATTTAQGALFLLLSGAPLREPIAWRGPIVMNTDEELQTAFEEYRAGTFLSHTPPKERSSHARH